MIAMAMTVVFTGASIVMAEGDPDLTVDTPTEDLVTRTFRFQVTGNTEPSIHVRVHVVSGWDEYWNNSTSLPDGSFDVQVELIYGYQNITVEAEDLAGNTTNITRAILWDPLQPDLIVRLVYLNMSGIPYNEEFGAYAVRERRIVINGTYEDDFSLIQDIVIRVNGETLSISIGLPGILVKTMDLDLGMNMIIVDATDEAGNRAMRTYGVYMDDLPPPLYITAPVEDELTRNATYNFKGETEPLTGLDIWVQSSSGSRDYNIMSAEDGTFETSIELFEGIQKVLVTVIDAMGNPTVIDLDVTLDTIPPDFVINRPDRDHVLTRDSIYTIVGTMLYDPDARVWIHLYGVEHTGIFSSEVNLIEGENLIEVKAVDEAGNEKVVVLTFIRDSTPPALTLTAPSGNTLFTNDPTVHFKGTVRDAVGVVVQQGAIDLAAVLVIGSWADGEWEYDLELGPMDMDQYVVVKAQDQMGNEAVITVHVLLNVKTPLLSIDREVRSYTNQTTVTISGTTEEGIETVMVNGVEAAVEGGVISVAVDLDDGANTFVISVHDGVGNVATNTIEIILDTVAPTFNMGNIKESDSKRGAIYGTCDIDVVRIWINGEPFDIENGTYELEVELPEDGRKVFVITFEDKAGNTVTETLTYSKGEETPGYGAWSAILGLSLMLVVVKRRRRD